MKFKDILKVQITQHPSTEPQDVVKMCYQAAYGAEHLIQNIEAAETYLLDEYNRTEEKEEPLYEVIGDSVCRVNLSAWKKSGVPLEWLFRLFLKTADRSRENAFEIFRKYIYEAEQLTEEGVMPFGTDRWKAYLQAYPCETPVAVHHSENYRLHEKPAYRLVHADYIKVFPILEAVVKGFHRQQVIALEGRAASGKTTLAELLKYVTGAEVIHMDDFFLPRELRTAERLAEPGGNVDYDRFCREVLPYLKSGEAFAYQCFDCGKMELGELRHISQGRIRVVEGCYSMHPGFGEYRSCSVFCDVSEAEQLVRIKERNGEEMLKRFVEEWIPMEEKYFAAFQVKEKADFVL